MTTIAAVLGKLEERTSNTDKRVETVEEIQAGHGNRLNILETWKQRITGGVILIGLMAPLFVLGIRESIFELFK
jgi:hypothetical protein